MLYCSILNFKKENFTLLENLSNIRSEFSSIDPFNRGKGELDVLIGRRKEEGASAGSLEKWCVG